MPKAKLAIESECCDAIKQIFDESRDGFNCEDISDYFLFLAHNKGVLQSTWLNYKHVLLTGAVPRQIKEMIFLAVSLSRGCHYCSSSHLALCDMYEISEESINSIIENVDSLNPEHIRRIIKFSLKVANNASSVTEQDYQTLMDAGLDMEEIVEIVSLSSFCVAGVLIAQAAGLDVEQATASYLKERNLSIGF